MTASGVWKGSKGLQARSDQRGIELEEMEKYREELLEKRNAFFAELSDVYKRF